MIAILMFKYYEKSLLYRLWTISGRGKKLFSKSIESYKTNKNVKNYQQIFHMYGRSSLRWFVSKICMLNLNILSYIVSEISTFIRTDGHGHRLGD